VPFALHIKQLADSFTLTLPDDFGYTLFVLFVISVLFGLIPLLRKKEVNKPLVLIAIPALIFIIYVSGFQKVRSHYFLIVYPSVAISAGYMCGLIISKFKKAGILLSLILLLIPFGISLNRDFVLTKKDTRVQLYEWLKSNQSVGDKIVYNSSTLQQVVEKAALGKVKKYSFPLDLEGSKGLFIYSSASSYEPTMPFVTDYQISLKYTLYPEGTAGNTIFIYTFNGVKQNESNQ
jgi:hypothetical protein